MIEVDETYESKTGEHKQSTKLKRTRKRTMERKTIKEIGKKGSRMK